MTNNDPMWETILATIDVTIGERVYHAGIIKRDVQYSLHIEGEYVPFEGKGDDNVATTLGIAQFAMMIGNDLK